MGVYSVISRFVGDLIEFFLPRLCYGCGVRFDTDDDNCLCPECRGQLEYFDFNDRGPNRMTKTLKGIEYGCWLMRFRRKELSQKLIHSFKYRKHYQLAVYFGRLSAMYLKDHHIFEDVDYLVPVPMHIEKKKLRGFNQTEKIASGMSEILGIPLYEDIVFATMNTISQTKLSRRKRKMNSGRKFDAHRIEDVKDKHFLIIDDVFTTGSTFKVLIKRMKEKMPECKISTFAIASV